MITRVILAAFFCFLFQHNGMAQVSGSFPNSAQSNNINQTDSLTAKDSVIVKNAFFKIFKGKPGRAALYSLLIPGAGQIYNKKYWKAPIAWAIDGGLGYNVYYQSFQYNHFNKLYQEALVSGSNNILIYKENRDKFRKAKEFSWLYLVFGHILTTLDAYVDRHMMEFDIDPDLTLLQIPGQTTIALGMQISIHSFCR